MNSSSFTAPPWLIGHAAIDGRFKTRFAFVAYRKPLWKTCLNLTAFRGVTLEIAESSKLGALSPSDSRELDHLCAIRMPAEISTPPRSWTLFSV
jgi:hypothetical protein